MSAPGAQSVVDWGNVAQWVAAFVMSLVALVALFKEEILKRWRRPILDLSLRVTPPDCYKTELRICDLDPEIMCRYLDLVSGRYLTVTTFACGWTTTGRREPNEFKSSRQDSIAWEQMGNSLRISIFCH